MYWHDMAWWAWIPMSVGMLLFWAFVAWLVLRLLPRGDSGGTSEPSARRILDLRFARGDIGADEYQQARSLLEREAQGGG